MNLREIAHSRTGDKGDTSNISLIAFNPQRDFAFMLRVLTPERILAELAPALRHFAVGQVTVERYELAQLGALNFVIKGILKGGVTRSLSLDAHGKSLGSLLLHMQLTT